MAVADDVESNKKRQQSLSAELSCATRIITLLIQLWLNLCPADVTVLEAALTSEVNDATKQVELLHSDIFSTCSVSVVLITGTIWWHYDSMNHKFRCINAYSFSHVSYNNHVFAELCV